MPKNIDPAVKERALRMVAEHRGEYATLTACCDQIGHRLGFGKETVRRRAVQADLEPASDAHWPSPPSHQPTRPLATSPTYHPLWQTPAPRS
ncbi:MULTISPECIES: hypothetical protein [Dietzia]|uniref:hypothetical protein n=1 Tax=Dietzia TaxID=37914 RepID=UPI0021177E74|nr:MULTISPECIES: hypothetical protein [Dietzia]